VHTVGGAYRWHSQAYHHPANGRAEVAGQQLMEKLRTLFVKDKINWVEVLPTVLDRIHDLPGESGISPYEILFGRTRPMGNLPYRLDRECEDVESFFSRMQQLDVKISQVLNDRHARKAQLENSKRKDLPPLQLGSKVWYRRPEKSGDKLDSRWLGPAIVVSREGERSYVIKVNPDHEMKAHRSFLKPFKEEIFVGSPTPLFFHQRTVLDPSAAPDEYEVDKILRHRRDEKGNYEFLTKWKGFDVTDSTWEPIGNFFHRYSSDFVKYVVQHKLSINVPSYLLSHPNG
jgi:hypothetical protein